MLDPVLTRYDVAPGVTAFSTTRHGGAGCGAHASMNINAWCGDNADAVARNREALCRKLGISGDRLIVPHQTHGTAILDITEEFLATDGDSRAAALEGIDAVMTDVKGVCVGVSTADCIPILLYDGDNGACCAVHAGWRGTAGRIAEKAVGAMTAAYGTAPQRLKAVIGPGISVENFEVGDEVYEAFCDAGFDMKAISRRQDKWHIDLWECNRRQLEHAGLARESIRVTGICTFAHADDYFSARRLGTDSGRIFNGIMIK